MKNIRRYLPSIIVLTGSLLLLFPALANAQHTLDKNKTTRTDTIYEQKMINGKLTTIRRIILYDSVSLIPKIKPRRNRNIFINQQANVEKIPQPTFQKIITKPQFKKPIIGQAFGLSTSIWHKTIQPNPPFISNVGTIHDFESKPNPLIFMGGFYNASIHYQNWYFKTGFQLQTSKQTTNFRTIKTHIDSTIFKEPITYDSIVIDTIYYLDITQLPDTIYFTHIDTFTQTINDTLLHTFYDTLTRRNKYKLTNRYFYIEIPLMAGHTFNMGSTKLSIDAGVILTLLSQVRLRLTDQNHNITQLNHKYAHSLNLDVRTAIHWRFPIAHKKYITCSSGIQYNLLNLYKNHNFDTHKKIRLNFAIGYFFN